MSRYVMLFFFFKQKTAYEMRISDWSSDVCSSDLLKAFDHPRAACDPLSKYLIGAPDARSFRMCRLDRRLVAHMGCHLRAQTATCVMDTFEIGRASCRERVCQ